MMRSGAVRILVRSGFTAAAVAVILAAYLRGNYLLGPSAGAAYTVISLSLLWLLACSRTPAGRLSLAQAGVVATFALPVGYALAFPASVNPDVQRFIDKQATDRAARAELAAVFRTDLAFGDLSVSSVHLKVVNVTVRGSVPSRSDFDRLRSRVLEQCPSLGECFLHWNVHLRDDGQRIGGLDRDRFPDDLPGLRPRGPGTPR